MQMSVPLAVKTARHSTELSGTFMTSKVSAARRASHSTYGPKPRPMQLKWKSRSSNVGDPDKHDVERYLKRWLATLRASGDYSPTTLLNCGHHINRISVVIGRVPLSKLTAADVDHCYAALLDRGLSRGTVRGAHSTLQTALMRARKWKFIATNPANDATPPKNGKPSVRALTQDEAARIITTAELTRRRDGYPGLETLVHLALSTGLRRGEILGLAFDVIDLEEGLLTVRRTVIDGEDRLPILREGIAKTRGSLRTISLSKTIVERLRTHKLMTMEHRMKWGPEYATGPLLVFPAVGGAPMKPAAPPRQALDRVKVEPASTRPTDGSPSVRAALLRSSRYFKYIPGKEIQ